RRVVVPDPAAAEVRKEIVALVLSRELQRLRVIERPAGDGAADGGPVAVLVGEDRAAEARVARRPLGSGPAVVRAGDPLVDLLPGGLAHVVDEDPAGAGLD